jgi:cysteinyl-tRNA synthetase
MTIRFFILQAHYRSTVDFSNEALQASEKGLSRLLDAYAGLQKISPSETSSIEKGGLRAKCYDAMNDDLNTPIVIDPSICDAARIINTGEGREINTSSADLQEL